MGEIKKALGLQMEQDNSSVGLPQMILPSVMVPSIVEKVLLLGKTALQTLSGISIVLHSAVLSPEADNTAVLTFYKKKKKLEE